MNLPKLSDHRIISRLERNHKPIEMKQQYPSRKSLCVVDKPNKSCRMSQQNDSDFNGLALDVELTSPKQLKILEGEGTFE